ncbi:hypothetical protein CRQ31_07390 [Salmonella enterica subsp. enterica serovar Worthington]|uniref:hypothetical protein n=1 Tax=Salmonella enterica TaxID=28901 RepID=UPI000FADABE8|nr:hypothetical protein [Salmonella enterica]EGI5052067.1 hypothetical protein [Salmonella enterica subsp. enterica serovar Worthington]QGR32909.1 hypothetical protein FOC16_08530 [Salmonella enterica]
MDLEITGAETPEELEALLDKIGDIEVSDDEQTETPLPDKPDNHQPEVQTGDTVVPTPGTETDEGTGARDDQEPEKGGILTRDGKHIIPYDVLEAERADKQRLAQQSLTLQQQLEEYKRRNDLLTSQINQAGMTPEPLPENLRITDEQIARVRDAYPDLAELMSTMVRKYDYLQSRIQENPQDLSASSPDISPVLEAMEAVPDLKAWQNSDPDRFSLAVHLDEKLQSDPDWKDKPLTERFTEVARRTRAAYGERDSQTDTGDDPVTPDPRILNAAAQKEAAARNEVQLPESPSDIGAGASESGDVVARAASASPEELARMMAGMSDAEIDALMERVGL